MTSIATGLIEKKITTKINPVEKIMTTINGLWDKISHHTVQRTYYAKKNFDKKIVSYYNCIALNVHIAFYTICRITNKGTLPNNRNYIILIQQQQLKWIAYVNRWENNNQVTDFSHCFEQSFKKEVHINTENNNNNDVAKPISYCLHRKILWISTESSTGSLVNEFQKFSYKETSITIKIVALFF